MLVFSWATNDNGRMPRLTVEYKAYIRSEAWAAFRARYFAASGTRKSCLRCRKRKGIHLHHLTYERLGHEQFGDVVPLCNDCHQGVHRFHGAHTQLSLAEATLKYCGTKPTTKKPLRLLRGESVAQERARRLRA